MDEWEVFICDEEMLGTSLLAPECGGGSEACCVPCLVKCGSQNFANAYHRRRPLDQYIGRTMPSPHKPLGMWGLGTSLPLYRPIILRNDTLHNITPPPLCEGDVLVTRHLALDLSYFNLAWFPLPPPDWWNPLLSTTFWHSNSSSPRPSWRLRYKGPPGHSPPSIWI